MLDVKKEGCITKESLTAGYRRVYGRNAEQKVEEIFSKVDIDNSGRIEYSEWVVATIGKEKILTEENLRKAFNLLDVDKSQTISPSEIENKVFCGQMIDEEIWSILLEELGLNQHGEIDFEAFCRMIQVMVDQDEGIADQNHDDVLNEKALD